ncbi:MAG: hypothetical protein ACLPXZ_26745 [Mycobacterium sp.]
MANALTPPRGPTLLARMLLVLSAAALPLAVLLLRRFDRWGALVVEAGCAILFARDLTMIVTGAKARLRPLPMVLLVAELVTSGTAVVAGWRSANDSAGTQTAGTPTGVHSVKPPNDSPVARLRTIAAAATFALHTVRQAIYVSPGQGYVITPYRNGNPQTVPKAM